MKYPLFLILAVCLLASSALGTDITIGSSTISGFNASVGSDVSMSGVSVTNASTAVTCSSCVPSGAVGMGGFKISLNGVTYDVASVASGSAFTLGSAYAGVTGTVTGTWYKFAVLRIYLTGVTFTPLGSSTPIPQSSVGSKNIYQRYGVSVINNGSQNIAYLPQISNLPATTDGQPGTSRWAAVIYTQGGTIIQYYPACISDWKLNAADLVTSWTDICSFNIANQPVNPIQEYYTAAEINNIIPSCSTNQLIYNAVDGRPKLCLTLGTGLSIAGGTISASAVGSFYTTVQEEGSNLTQRSTLNFVGSTATAADDAGSSRTNVTFDSDVNALASTGTTGVYVITGSGTSTTRTIVGTANEIDVANGSGVSGNPTISLPTTIILTGKAITGGTFGSPTLNFPTINGANVRNATNVMLYGCTGNGIANDTSCVASALAGAVLAAGQTLYFPAGTYLIDTLAITSSNLIVVGDGPGHTILKSRVNTSSVIAIDNSAAARNGIKIRDLEIQGFGSGASNHGIASTGVTARNSMTVENVKISAVGGSAILSNGGALSNSRFTDLDLDQPAGAVGHTIDIVGAGTNQIVRTYVHNVADNLTAFRLRSGNWYLRNVTAQDSGTSTGWGIIGQDVANDGTSTPAFLQCEGCTVTLWGGTDGIDIRSASFASFFATAFSTKSSGTYRALRFRGMTNGNGGVIDAITSFTLNGSAAWTNSQPVHSVEPPFTEIGSEELTAYYDTTLTTTIALSGIRQQRVDTSRAGVFIKNIATGTAASTGFISHILFAADNTYNIGTASSGQRPANIYVASTGFFPNAIQVGAPSGSTGEARFYTSSNSNAVRLQATAGSSDYNFIFPSSPPTAGNEFLQISNTGAVTSNIAVWQNKAVNYTPDITVANTTTETSIAGAADVGSYTVSANTARVGQMFKLTSGGTIGGLATGALTGNITLKWKFGVGGGTTICSTGAIAINQDGTGATWSYETYAVITALGGSGSLTCYRGTFFYNSTNGSTAISFGTAKTTTAIDTTVANAFDTTLQFSVADAKNTATATWTQIETAR